jgi:hypothetical protein
MDRFAWRVRAPAGAAVTAFIASLLIAGCSREPLTPEARKQRGDEIIRAMSDYLARAKTISVETTDTRTRDRRGKEVTLHTTRLLTIRRPNRLAFRVSGDVDLRGWYDGEKVTFVSDPQKVWARANGASSIDDTLDRLADGLALPMPMADFLYSSPYDALIGTRSTGGYVNRETVGGVACHHVTYSHPAVDWELWIPEEGDPLPKKFVVTNKTTTPASTAEVTFDKWTYGVDTPDATFAPEVPAGYERVQIVVGAPETSPASPASPTGAPQQ